MRIGCFELSFAYTSADGEAFPLSLAHGRFGALHIETAPGNICFSVKKDTRSIDPQCTIFLKCENGDARNEVVAFGGCSIATFYLDIRSDAELRIRLQQDPANTLPDLVISLKMSELVRN